jgi:hypothetical protein
MAEGFQVVLDELAAAAGKFDEEGQSLTKVANGLPQSGPDTGDAGLNATLTAVLSATQFLGAALAEQASDHGSKLTTAHDNYRRTDSDNTQLFDQLMKK